MKVGRKGDMRMSITARAQAQIRQSRERAKPKYIARAKVGGGWVNIGAAWPLRSGEEGYSLKLTTIPLNWDGRFILLPPLENDDPGEAPPEETPPKRTRRKADDDNTPL